jgi:hypothetical protein
VAKMLSAAGLSVYPTTIAKIEAGERAARVDEVVAVADLFSVSVDTLLGHTPREGGNDPHHSFGVCRGLLEKAAEQLDIYESSLRFEVAVLDGSALQGNERAALKAVTTAANLLVPALDTVRKARAAVNRVLVARFPTNEEGTES